MGMDTSTPTPAARRAARSLWHDEAHAANSSLARVVSAKLRKAGLTKASAYKSFGRDVDGYGIYTKNIRETYPEAHTPVVTVYFTNERPAAQRCDVSPARADHDKAVEILTAAGYVCVTAPRSWSIEVSKVTS